MEECKSTPVVHDVEEGEISDDSASSVEEISEEAFNKKDLPPPPPASAAAPPSPPPSVTENSNVDNHNNQQQKQRVWTMRDLYKYQVSRHYSAGLYNLAWASAVQNKPLDEVLSMEFPNTESNGGNSNSNSKRCSSLTNIQEPQAEGQNLKDENVHANESSGEGKVEEEEKEEGELEEGEIDFDSDMVVEDDNGELSKEKDKEADCDRIRKALESVTAEDAEKSFDEVSSRIQNLLACMQEMAQKNLLTAKDVIVQLAFAAIETVYTVFSSMNLIQKECSKEIVLRLLAQASNRKYLLFSAEQLEEMEVMIAAMDSQVISLSSKDARTDNETKELEAVAKNDNYLSSTVVERVPTNGVDVESIAVEASDKPEPQTPQEYTKYANTKYRGLTLPLLDLHKDHDPDNLPSPTRGGSSCLPKGMAVGYGLLKPEWPVPRVLIDRDNVQMHPYETDAVRAVSSYQQKFGRSSFHMNDRLPSPTPSEECDDGDCDMSGEVSSSSNGDVNPVNSLRAGHCINSTAKMEIRSVQGQTNLCIAPSSYGTNSSLKSSSAKSRDPRLRLANADVAALNRLLPVVNNEHNAEPVGPIINSKKQKTVEDPVFDGPATKRQRTEGAQILNDVQAVTGTGGWLEDRGIVGLGHKSHELRSSGSDPRKLAVTGVTSSSTVPFIAVNSNENVPSATPSVPPAFSSLLNDIVVNPSLWMNIIKIEQKKSTNPKQAMTQPLGSNSLTGAVPSTNVAAPKLSVPGDKAAGMLQVTPQTASVEELGKVRMKPRDPRRILHDNTVQKGRSLEVGQSLIRTTTSSSPGTTMNIQRQDDQLDKKCTPSHSFAPPDIASQFTKNLKTIADIVSVSQATSHQPVLPKIASSVPLQAHQGRTDAVSLSESGNPQTMSGLDFKVAFGASRPQSDWGDVEHLFEGFDDQQKAAIHKERARRMEEQRKMFAGRKLCLVLDLDHTLLNSAKFTEVDSMHDEILRKKEELDRERSQRHLFRFPHMGMWTKLRPGIWNFLEKASKLYELHLYTMGNKLYATEMAKLLDPKGELFAGRVISRGDDGDLFDGDERVPKSKDLEGVMGMESSVVIIDDSLRVWPRNKLNLIVVERYIYFPCSRRQFGLPGPSLLEIDHDERPEDGTLASSLAVIERIHETFFAHQSLDEADIRNILASEQRKILGGCCILFSRVFPVGEANPHLHPLWQTAEQFGAVCTNSIDEQVTHVVANSLGTDKVNWAISTGRFVVHPGWVEASALLYRRANEHDFAIKP